MKCFANASFLMSLVVGLNCMKVVVAASCANVRCAAGTICIKVGGKAQCVPAIGCANILCDLGTSCVELNGKPQCVSTTKPRRCLLPQEPGTCRGAFPRYFYNYESGECEKFTYGGCGGNRNRFSDAKCCVDVCLNDNGDKCDLPVDPGPCEAHMKRYFYNMQTNGCEKFYYGGCEGNKNRFRTRKQCQWACFKERRCNMTVDPGPCDRDLERYFYNYESCACESFSYGGCGGNWNRFPNKERCKNVCTDIREVCPDGTVGICVEKCSSDKPCKEGEICCFNGCGHTCIIPP